MSPFPLEEGTEVVRKKDQVEITSKKDQVEIMRKKDHPYPSFALSENEIFSPPHYKHLSTISVSWSPGWVWHLLRF